MIKIKQLPGKSVAENTVRVYYIPSLNNGTESGIIACGHHSFQDGVTQMQAYYRIADKIDGAEYPFHHKVMPPLKSWMMAYLTIPLGIRELLKRYRSHNKDINCIKKHSDYVSGK